MQKSDVVPADRPEFILTRVFNAPRAAVYNIWSDPHYVQQWWGVDGSTITVCELDVRPGGKYRIDMKTSDGTVYQNRGVYLEVAVNERIVSRDVRDGDDITGDLPSGTHTVTFAETNGATLVTLTSHFETREARDLMVRLGMIDGIGQSLERFNQFIIKHFS